MMLLVSRQCCNGVKAGWPTFTSVTFFPHFSQLNREWCYKLFKVSSQLIAMKKMIIMLLFELVIVDWCRNMSFLRVRNANRPSLPKLQRTEVVQKCTGRLHDDSDDSDDDGNSSKSVSSSASQVRFCYSLLASLLVLYTWEHNNNVDQCCKLLKTFVWTLTFRGDNDAPADWL